MHKSQTITRRTDTLRSMLMTGAAALALAVSLPAAAQQQGAGAQAQGQQPGQQPGQAQSQQAGSQQPAVVGQLRTVQQSLRQAESQISGGQQPNFGQARTAVNAGLEALGRVPQQMQGQEPYRAAQRELNEVQQALQGQQPNAQQVANQLREAAASMDDLVGRMSGMAGTAMGQQQVQVQPGQPQVSVQQPAPQITVQQPQPDITVVQPPPQVTVQQPQPQVTVQQPQPQVTVRQARPDVTVLQSGQPDVTVRQPGEPEVTVRRPVEPQVTVQERDAQRQQGSAEQRAGATSATPAPAQSGSRAQPTAASPAAGVPLQSVQALIGTNVVGTTGRDAGEVRNLLIDNQGRVRAAVVEWGGFLGIGSREAMVPIERIRLGQGNERAQLAMTREELEALPRYDRDRVADYGRERGWGEGLRLYR